MIFPWKHTRYPAINNIRISKFSPNMLEASHLTKRFSRHLPPALDDVSFAVGKGEIFGLLGHNGAGKSTAFGIMFGMVHANSGEVKIGGVSVQKRPPQGALESRCHLRVPRLLRVPVRLG